MHEDARGVDAVGIERARFDDFLHLSDCHLTGGRHIGIEVARRLAIDEVALGVADRVRFLGEVDRKDLPDLYRGADLFAMTSFS